MKSSKYLFVITMLMLVSLTLKSQEPDPSWELSLSKATPYWDYLPGNLLELKDGNYLIPLISTIDYMKPSERSCEAKILKISSNGEIMDEIALKYDKEYKLNDISVDIWNDTVNVFSHLIANDHTGSKITHNYLFDDLTISEQKEIYKTEFDTLMAAVYYAKRGNVPLIDNEGNRTMLWGYRGYTGRLDKCSSKYDKDFINSKVVLLKFDTRFNIVAESWYDVEELYFSFIDSYTLNYNQDSTAYYFMSKAVNKPFNSQYVFDLNLNYKHRNSYTCYPQANYDVVACNWTQNPYDGEIYGFGEVYTIWQDSELFMFKLKKDNHEAVYDTCSNTENDINNMVLPGNNVCFSADGNIYGLGIYNYFMYPYFVNGANVCYIGVYDKALNYQGEWYYQISPDYNHFFDNIYYTKSDDIIITGELRHEEDGIVYYEPYMTKFPASAFVNIEEAHAHNLKLAVAYPNPGGDIMNIRTGLRNAILSVYDMQGRKVHEQEITDEITSVDASRWESGTYVWELRAGNGNGILENGNVNGSGILENGKWVKE